MPKALTGNTAAQVVYFRQNLKRRKLKTTVILHPLFSIFMPIRLVQNYAVRIMRIGTVRIMQLLAMQKQK